MPAMSTFVPAAITGLLAAFNTAISPDPTLGGLAPRGVAVYDGDVRAGQPDSGYIVVEGWEITQREPATLGAPDFFTIEEQFDLTGSIWAFEGSEGQAVSRTLALTIFETVEAQVRADPTLGGAVRVVWFNHHAGTQGATAQGGNGTEITWRLHAEARIQ